MTTPKDFNMDATLRILDATSGNYPAGSKEEAAVQLAAVALLYIRRSGKLDDFFQYHREFSDPAFKVKISQTFATQEEADRWLASGRASDGELVKIAAQGFQVIRLPSGLRFLRTPLPEELGPAGSP